MRLSIRTLALAGFVMALAGCSPFRQSCEARLTPEEIATIPLLRVPAGVAPPDTSNALRIPELNTPERPRRPSDPCLEAPPAYSPGWQPDENAQPEPLEGETEQPKKRRWWWPWG